jgi:hypothetical protein
MVHSLPASRLPRSSIVPGAVNRRTLSVASFNAHSSQDTRLHARRQCGYSISFPDSNDDDDAKNDDDDSRGAQNRQEITGVK